jgi:hypothetical protein
MKFSLAAVSALLLAEHTLAFVSPQSPFAKARISSSSPLNMALDMPPPAPEVTSDVPAVVQQNNYGQPTEVRYSDFLRLIDANKVEKVTFSADGTQLLGVDVDGARLTIESLPNDPDLLTQLTSHKVCSKILIDALLCVSSSVRKQYLIHTSPYPKFAVTG